MPSGPRGQQAYCTRGALSTRLNGQRAARGKDIRAADECHTGRGVVRHVPSVWHSVGAYRLPGAGLTRSPPDRGQLPQPSRATDGKSKLRQLNKATGDKQVPLAERDLERPADHRTVKPLCPPRLPEGPARQAGPTQEQSLRRASEMLISGLARPRADNQKGDESNSCPEGHSHLGEPARQELDLSPLPAGFIRAWSPPQYHRAGNRKVGSLGNLMIGSLPRSACQMESRSWGNLTRLAGSRSPPLIGQIIGHIGSTVLHSAEQRLIGEMKGTPPERSHVPTATHGLALWIANCAAAAGCRGNLPVGSLSFGAPASTFHSDAQPLLLLALRIVALRM